MVNKKRKRLVLDITGTAGKKMPVPVLFEYCQQAKIERPLLCSMPLRSEPPPANLPADGDSVLPQANLPADGDSVPPPVNGHAEGDAEAGKEFSGGGLKAHPFRDPQPQAGRAAAAGEPPQDDLGAVATDPDVASAIGTTTHPPATLPVARQPRNSFLTCCYVNGITEGVGHGSSIQVSRLDTLLYHRWWWTVHGCGSIPLSLHLNLHHISITIIRSLVACLR